MVCTFRLDGLCSHAHTCESACLSGYCGLGTNLPCIKTTAQKNQCRVGRTARNSHEWVTIVDDREMERVDMNE